MEDPWVRDCRLCQGPRNICVMCSGKDPDCILCDGEGLNDVYPEWECERYGHSFGHGYTCHYCGYDDWDGEGKAPLNLGDALPFMRNK